MVRPEIQHVLDRFQNYANDYIKSHEQMLIDKPENKEWIEKAMADKLDGHLLHGTRRKESPEQIKQSGICTFSNAEGLKNEMLAVIHDLGKDYLLTSKGKTGRDIRYMLKDIESMQNSGRFYGLSENPHPARLNIYVNNLPERACSWASRNPEIIWDLLWRLGLDRNINSKNANNPQKNAYAYLEKRYGKPYVIKLKYKLAIKDPNVNLGVPCLLPEDIEDVTQCTIADINQPMFKEENPK